MIQANDVITGMLDWQDRAGFARRVADPGDRWRVNIEVKPTFHKHADRIWGPMAADLRSTLAKRFTTEELERIADFLRAVVEIGRRRLDRLRET